MFRQKVSTASSSTKIHNKKDQKYGRTLITTSKRYGSPNKIRDGMRNSKLESSQRWRVFLSDDSDFRRFLSGPLKKMVYNLSKLHNKKVLKITLDHWKDNCLDKSGENDDNMLYQSTANADTYEQEFMWDDPTFNPYEEDGEEKLQDFGKVEDDDESAIKFYNAADGRPLDVDELHVPFQVEADKPAVDSKPLPLSNITAQTSTNINHSVPAVAYNRPRFNETSTITTFPQYAAEPIVPSHVQTLEESIPYFSRESSLIFDESKVFSRSSNLSSEHSSTAPSKLPVFSFPVSSASFRHPSGQLPLAALRQSSWNSSQLDDAEGLDEGFELPP